MADLAFEIADIEKELLALTGNQPPNPNKMPIYTVSGVSASDPQVRTIVFDDGIIRLTKAFAEPGGYAFISYVSGNLELYVAGVVPVDFTVVSLGKFTIV
jgi:hypothetical protein